MIKLLNDPTNFDFMKKKNYYSSKIFEITLLNTHTTTLIVNITFIIL